MTNPHEGPTPDPAAGVFLRPPFDHRFFHEVFPERVRALCAGPSVRVPIVLIELADGCTLDLCHLELLTPRWLAAAVFRDSADCAEMDTAFVPYETVIRVTLSTRKAGERRFGFQLGPLGPSMGGMSACAKPGEMPP